jgi:hypothetical protein
MLFPYVQGQKTEWELDATEWRTVRTVTVQTYSDHSYLKVQTIGLLKDKAVVELSK